MGSYNSLLLFGHARREQLGLRKRACVPSDDFLQRELGRAAMGIAYSANYEQCLVPLEYCCFDAALLYGIRSRHANASRHCQITMRLASSESSLVKHRSGKRPAFMLACRIGLITRSEMSVRETGMVTRCRQP